MKTLFKITLIASSVLCTSSIPGHSQEEDQKKSNCGVPLYSKDAEDNLLFKFLLQSKILQVLEDNEAVVKKISGKDLPYRALSNQLEAILCKLIAEEVSIDTRIIELRNHLNNMPIGQTKELLHQNLQKIFHFPCNEMSCQSTLDERSINLFIEFFTWQIYEKLDNLDPSEQAEFLTDMYEQQLKAYYELCGKHKANLDKIQERANLQFPKSGDNDKRPIRKTEIKSLSELLQDKQEIESPAEVPQTSVKVPQTSTEVPQTAAEVPQIAPDIPQPEPSIPEPTPQVQNPPDNNAIKKETEAKKAEKNRKKKSTDGKKEKGPYSDTIESLENKTKETYEKVINTVKNWFKKDKKKEQKK